MVGIKGWKMPEKCADCALCIDVPQMKGKDLWCCGGLEKSPIIETFYDGVKPDFCPLVEVPDWHDVNDLPPLFDKEVLIYDADIGVALGWLACDGKWQTDEINELDAVTHWQQIVLPEK